jgi:hypothetical protein
MDHQSQDGRVDRATSRRWCAPVMSAGLRVTMLAGFAGAAWLLGGSSAAHAETATTADAVQPATSGILGSLSRPVAAVASPVTKISAATATPKTGKASGALAPATTPVSEAIRVVRAPASTATHVLGTASRAVAQDTGLRPPPAGPLDSPVPTVMAVPKNLLTPLGTGRVAGHLTPTVRPAAVLTDPVATIARPGAAPAIANPSGGLTKPAGHQSAGDQGGSTAAPHQPAVVTVAHNPVAHAPVAQRFRTVSTLDSASSPVAGAASVAPALPRPAPGDVPGLPGTGLMNSGNTATSSSSQFGGSAGALVPGSHPAALLAPRAGLLPVESVVPLVRAEELAAVPD